MNLLTWFALALPSAGRAEQEINPFSRTISAVIAMVIPYVVVGNPNELAIVSGVGYSQPKFLSDGFAVVVACFHKVTRYRDALKVGS